MALHFLYYNFVPQHLNESFMPPFVIPTASATVSIPRDRMTLVMRGNVIGCGGHFLADIFLQMRARGDVRKGGQTRSFGDVGLNVRFARKRKWLGDLWVHA